MNFFFCDCLHLGFIFGRVIGWNEVGGQLKTILEVQCRGTVQSHTQSSQLNFATRLTDTPSIHITFPSPQIIAMGKVKSQKPLPLIDTGIRCLMLGRLT